MKKKLIASALLSVTLLSTLASTASVVNAAAGETWKQQTGVVVVDKANKTPLLEGHGDQKGGAMTYILSNRTVNKSSKWKTTNFSDKDNKINYNVGLVSYLPGSVVSFVGNLKGTESKYSGVALIKYVPGYGVNLWNGYGKGAKFTGRRLADGTKWKVFKNVYGNDGNVWYNLGGNQWIQGKYVVIQ